MDVRPLSAEEKSAIYENFVTIADWKQIGPFCVDGRDGAVKFVANESNDHIFVQALGGSLLIAVIQYLKQGGDFESVQKSVLATFREAGFGCGVHRGSHASSDASDCGFADNLQKIITRLVSDKDTIAQLIDEAAPGVRNEEIWQQVLSDASARKDTQLPTGEDMVSKGHAQGANLQTLDGEHAEVAAVVNLAEGSTLNTGAMVEQNMQAFNLDLWYVLKQAEVVGLDAPYVLHAALGLYVATEMVLVEDKKQIRLPILINQ